MNRIRLDSSRVRLSLISSVAGLLVVTSTLGPEAPADATGADLSPCVNPDNGLPVVQDIAFSPAVVDVTKSAQPVTVTMEVRDTGGPGPASGLRHVSVRMTAPDGLEIPVTLHHEEGSTWTGALKVPRQAPDGQWSVEQPFVSDRAGNHRGEEHLAAVMAQAPWETTLSVISDPDTLAPTVTRMSIRPNRVNTRHRARRVRFIVRAFDRGSGIDAAELGVKGGGSSHTVELHKRDSTWTGTLTVPRWVGRKYHTWRVRTLHFYDRVGNRRSFLRDEVATLGEHSFRVRSGRNDTASPRLRRARIRPRTVDVRTERDRARIVVRLADRTSGVRTVTAGIPSKSVKLRRVSGTTRRGTWVGRLHLRPCTKNVHSSLVQVRAFDRRGNEMFELPMRLRVRARDNTTPHVQTESTRIAPTGPLTLLFNEPVNGITSSSVVVRSSPFPELGPVEAGSWECEQRDGSSTSCLTGRVRRAMWTPADPLAPATNYLVELNPEGVLDVTDLAGNPFRRVTVGAFTE